MTAPEIIRKKRDGGKLTRDELEFFVRSYLSDAIPDYQASAFLMSVFFRGMDFDETVWLTDVMLRSGEVVDLRDVPGLKVDKHSTGGVGDKVSLIVAPAVAACGVPVPMMSGRGLGHTGGTLDKLESIPGFRTDLSVGEYRRMIAGLGIAMIGQTDSVAPADKKLYALRDVTGTVECIPLIAASIMSKKLAEGIDALVLDVKCGRGAFLPGRNEAVKLAETLIEIGKRYGKRTVAFLTRMDQPLGTAVGNWVEVVEAVHCLRGDGPDDLLEVSLSLAGAMLMLGGKADSVEEGGELALRSLRDGSAYDKFLQMVKRQGGEVSAIENLESYPLSSCSLEVKCREEGFMASIDAREIGLISGALGAARTRVHDSIDPRAGIRLRKKVGDRVEAGETLAVIYSEIESALSPAKERLLNSVEVNALSPQKRPLIEAMMDADGMRQWSGRTG